MNEQELIEHINKYLSYDAKRGELIYKVSRGPRSEGSRAGSLGTGGYRKISIGPVGNHKQYMEHRVMFLLKEGRWPGIIDHINGIRDDNRWENIRECTQQQNCMNTSSRKGTSSKYRGVRIREVISFGDYVPKYLAQIYHNKKNVHLGYFDSEVEAAKAYNAASKMYFGKFGKLNTINED